MLPYWTMQAARRRHVSFFYYGIGPFPLAGTLVSKHACLRSDLVLRRECQRRVVLVSFPMPRPVNLRLTIKSVIYIANGFITLKIRKGQNYLLSLVRGMHSQSDF